MLESQKRRRAHRTGVFEANNAGTSKGILPAISHWRGQETHVPYSLPVRHDAGDCDFGLVDPTIDGFFWFWPRSIW